MNTFLAMRKKLVCSYSIETCASGYQELLESILSPAGCGSIWELLSILLWRNGFAGIRKEVVDQMGIRPPSSDQDFSFLVQVWLWEDCVASSRVTSELAVDGCQTKSTFATLHDLIENWFIVVV